MTLPLLHGADLLGLMHLDSLFTSNAFTEKDLQICTGMAAQAAIAIQNARLATRIEKEAQTGDFMPERTLTDEKVLRRDYERLRIGHELARAVGTELDLEKLLPKILDKAFELVGADRGAILLMDTQNEPVPRYVKTRSGKSDSNIVLSRTLRPGDYPRVRIESDAARLVTELRTQPGKDIAIFGGA